jgi:hypothetical protein
MIRLFKIVAAAVLLAAASPAFAQVGVPGLPLVPLGYCQLSATQLASAVGLASCVRASFTGTGSGTSLTTTSVSGIILVGDAVNSGSGVPAGTTIVSQTSGTPGGAGIYVTSQATTSSTAALTSGGVPPGANTAALASDTAAVRYRDDGAAPTASVGFPISTTCVILYVATLPKVQFIAETGSPVLNIAFYHSP